MFDAFLYKFKGLLVLYFSTRVVSFCVAMYVNRQFNLFLRRQDRLEQLDDYNALFAFHEASRLWTLIDIVIKASYDLIFRTFFVVYLLL